MFCDVFDNDDDGNYISYCCIIMSINISKYLLSVLHIQSTSTSTAQHDGGCYAVDLLGNFQQNPTHCTTVTPQMGEKL